MKEVSGEDYEQHFALWVIAALTVLYSFPGIYYIKWIEKSQWNNCMLRKKMIAHQIHDNHSKVIF